MCEEALLEFWIKTVLEGLAPRDPDSELQISFPTNLNNIKSRYYGRASSQMSHGALARPERKHIRPSRVEWQSPDSPDSPKCPEHLKRRRHFQTSHGKSWRLVCCTLFTVYCSLLTVPCTWNRAVGPGLGPSAKGQTKTRGPPSPVLRAVPSTQ